MILYHGSDRAVPAPDLLHSRASVDFGKGFYVTSIYDQAERWSSKFRRRGRDGVVSVYLLDETAFKDLRVLMFETYSEEWLDFVLECRSGRDQSDYDLVIGGVANDKVFNIVELYFDGLIEKTEALRRLRYEKPNMQICFRTQRSLSYLHFERSEIL